jgi:hypothetical protein
VNRQAAVVAAAIAAVIGLAGCGSSAAPVAPPPAVKRAVESSPATVGPVAQGRWTRVGGYDVRLDKTRFMDSVSFVMPGSTRGLQGISARVSVRIHEGGDATTVPVPEFMGGAFRLLDGGKAFDAGTICIERSMPVTPSPSPYGSGIQSTMAPIRVGEVYTLQPDFAVHRGAAHVVLAYSPGAVASSSTVLFTVR